MSSNVFCYSVLCSTTILSNCTLAKVQWQRIWLFKDIFWSNVDGKNKFERLIKPLTVEQVLNGMMIPCQKSEQPNKMRKCEQPSKMRKCEQPNKMRKCEQHNKMRRCEQHNKMRKCEQPNKMRTCEQPNNMRLHIQYNKTSVPVFYRRIKFRYEFGCVWIKARVPMIYFDSKTTRPIVPL